MSSLSDSGETPERRALREAVASEAARIGISVGLLLGFRTERSVPEFLEFMRTIPDAAGEAEFRRQIAEWEPGATLAPSDVAAMFEALREMERVVGDDRPPGGGDHLVSVTGPEDPADRARRVRALPTGAGWRAYIAAFRGDDPDAPDDSGEAPAGGSPAPVDDEAG